MDCDCTYCALRAQDETARVLAPSVDHTMHVRCRCRCRCRWVICFLSWSTTATEPARRQRGRRRACRIDAATLCVLIESVSLRRDVTPRLGYRSWFPHEQCRQPTRPPLKLAAERPTARLTSARHGLQCCCSAAASFQRIDYQ